MRTALYDWHIAHGARMVDFAGWDMPVQYTTIIDEHTAVRTAAGLFDISHMGRLHFAGPDALALIQQVYTNNAATMKEGQVRYGLVCNDKAGIRDDVLVYRWPDGYAMVVNASNREKILGWLAESQRLAQGATFRIRRFDTCMIAVQGPKRLQLCRGIDRHRRRPSSATISPRRRAAGDKRASAAPATPARTAWNSSSTPARACSSGKSWSAAGPSRAAWERATRFGSKPPCRFMAMN